MYDKFFLENSIIMNKKLPYVLRLLFQGWKGLLDGDKRSKYSDLVKYLLGTTPTTLLKRTIFLRQRQRPCVRPKVLSLGGSMLILQSATWRIGLFFCFLALRLCVRFFFYYNPS